MYVDEAHPEFDAEWQRPESVEDRVGFACSRQDIEARAADFTLPVLVDEPDARTRLAYRGFQARAVLVGLDGRISWAGGSGPAGLKGPVESGDLKAAIEAELAKAPPTADDLAKVDAEAAAMFAAFYDAPEGAGDLVALINCGGEAPFTDMAERVWSGDGAEAARDGGASPQVRDHWVTGTRDWPVYMDAVEGMRAYRLPLEDGAYVVRLHFAEILGSVGWRRGQSVVPGDRVFSVSLEGEAVLEDFDILKVTGNRRFTSVIRQFDVQVADGELTIEFAKSADREGAGNLPPIINAIEVRKKG